MAFRFNAVSGQLDLVGSGGVTDGDKGDIVVSSSGSVWTLETNLKTQPITFNISSGVAITTGIKAEWRCPYACTIQSWTLLADTSTTCAIDIWKDTFANYPPTDADSITNGHEPALTASTNAEDTSLGDWTTVAIAAGDVLIFNVDSNDNATRLTLILNVVKT
jgi:hypothetical protein